MDAVVVYESMFGNTHEVAMAIGRGLSTAYEVRVLPTGDEALRAAATADLVVIGGPTHAHGLSTASSRSSAADQAEHDPDLELDPDAPGPGLRSFVDDLVGDAPLAVFDTRVAVGPGWLTGRASHHLAKGLRARGRSLATEPMSFLVDRHNALLPGEVDRAESWARSWSLPLHADHRPFGSSSVDRGVLDSGR